MVAIHAEDFKKTSLLCHAFGGGGGVSNSMFKPSTNFIQLALTLLIWFFCPVTHLPTLIHL